MYKFASKAFLYGKDYNFTVWLSLTQIRKKKKLSQSEVGKLLNIDGDAYGRYQRNEVKPSIDMAAKIADILNVSLDYLIGKTDLEFDRDTLKRMEEISKLSDKNKEVVYIP